MFKKTLGRDKKILIATFLLFFVPGMMLNSFFMKNIQKRCYDSQFMTLETSDKVINVVFMECGGSSVMSALWIGVFNLPVSIVTLSEPTLIYELSKLNLDNVLLIGLLSAKDSSVISKYKRTTFIGVFLNAWLLTVMFSGRVEKAASRLPFSLN